MTGCVSKITHLLARWDARIGSCASFGWTLPHVRSAPPIADVRADLRLFRHRANTPHHLLLRSSDRGRRRSSEALLLLLPDRLAHHGERARELRVAHVRQVHRLEAVFLR